MYKFTPSTGKNLGIIDTPYTFVVTVASDTGGFEGNFEIDGDVKETFECPDKLPGDVNLSKESVKISKHVNATVDFGNETGEVESASLDSSVASAEINGHTITISANDDEQKDLDTSNDNFATIDVAIDMSIWWEELLNGEHTITVNVLVPNNATAVYKFKKATSGTVRKHKWKKVGYLINPITDEIEAQKVILCDRRLHRICELTPVENLRYVLNELNKANEISFSYYKYVDDNNIHGFENSSNPNKYKPCPGFDRLQDLSIVQVGNEYFEVAVTKSDDGSLKKSVSGVSLGFAELSQLISTININTDEELDFGDFQPTIFYNKDDPDHSLLHRILKDAAPHYQIGHVDNTLWKMQRTFSWDNTDVLTMLNNIGEEVNCVFDITVTRDTNGNAERLINAYDLCYCKTCWAEVRQNGETAEPSADTYRNIVNGKCQRCEELGRDPYNLHDIGYTTNVFLSTDHMANSITVNGNKDQIKNSFKVEGGDDFMTDAVHGLSMSAANNITIFSPQTKKEMSIPLHNALDQYEADYKELQPYYDELMKTIYNIQDAIGYLEHSRMPVSDEVITDTAEAMYDMINKFSSKEKGVGFNSTVYVDKRDENGSTGLSFTPYIAESTLRKMLTLYVPKGFFLEVKAETNSTSFNGSISLRKNIDTEDCITLEIKSGSVIVKKGNKNKSTVDPSLLFPDPIKMNVVTTFRPKYMFAEEYNSTTQEWKVNAGAFAEYIKQYTLMLIQKNFDSFPEYSNDRKRNWGLYSLERLQNYLDGYKECASKMTELTVTSETDWARKTCDEMYMDYIEYAKDIQRQMDIIEDQIVALNLALGPSKDEDGNEIWPDRMLDSSGNMKYQWKSTKKFPPGTDYRTVILSLLANDVNGYNGQIYEGSTGIGDKPFACKKCGSNQVAVEGGVNICLRPGCNASGDDILTYKSLASDILQFVNVDVKQSPYTDYYTNTKTTSLTEIQSAIRDKFNLKNYLNPNNEIPNVLYDEMMSFVREDVYQNSNYTTEGLNTNTEIINQARELLNKATRELAKACIPQYTISMSLSSILALEPIEWQGKTMNADFKNFCINNYVRVRIDDDIYRLRIASIELSYPVDSTVSVTFTDASRYLGGGMDDIASIISAAQSMATSYNYTATQAEKGVIAENIFENIYNSGMDSALMNIKAARNQDITIDQHGILIKELNEYTDRPDKHQLQIINRNIVFTDDEWKTTKLAIGLMRFPYDVDTFGELSEKTGKIQAVKGGTLMYGVCATYLCGEIIAGKRLVISNGDRNVSIGEHGIAIQGGYLDVGIPPTEVVIDPLLQSPYNCRKNSRGQSEKINNKIIMARVQPTNGVVIDGNNVRENNDGVVFSVDTIGNAFFAGQIWARSGHIANWNIGVDELSTDGASFKYSGMYFGKEGISISNKFWVTKDGNAYFDGEMHSNKGHIANWLIRDGYLMTEGYPSTFDSNGFGTGVGEQYFGVGGLYIGTNFVVKPDGTILARNGKFYGEIWAQKGKIGIFNIKPSSEAGVDCMYTDSWGKGSTSGICMTEEAIIAANDYNNGKGTYIGANGYIKTSRFAVYGTNGWFPDSQYHPVSLGSTGVTFDVVQGGFLSKNLTSRPYQLKINGANEWGNDMGSAYIGMFQQGRMIIGINDYGNPDDNNSAFKLNVDGSVYIKGKIHFGNGNSGERYVLKLVHNNNDPEDTFVVKAIKKSNGVKAMHWVDTPRDSRRSGYWENGAYSNND